MTCRILANTTTAFTDSPGRSPRRPIAGRACAILLVIGLGGLGAANADNPTSTQVTPARIKTPSWGTPTDTTSAPAANVGALGGAASPHNSRSTASPQLMEPTGPFESLTPDQQIRSLHESVRLLQTQLAAANTRLAADEDRLAHHTHSYQAPHFYITTAKSVLNDLNSASNPGIVWMSRQIEAHPTGPAVFSTP